MIHMTEVHPGHVGVTEGPFCKVEETVSMARYPRKGWLHGSRLFTMKKGALGLSR